MRGCTTTWPPPACLSNRRTRIEALATIRSRAAQLTRQRVVPPHGRYRLRRPRVVRSGDRRLPQGDRMSPFYAGIANLWMGNPCRRRGTGRRRSRRSGKSIRLLPRVHFTCRRHTRVVRALIAAGRQAEADDMSREALRLKLKPDEPSWLAALGGALARGRGQTRRGVPEVGPARHCGGIGLGRGPAKYLRYDAACFADESAGRRRQGHGCPAPERAARVSPDRPSTCSRPSWPPSVNSLPPTGPSSIGRWGTCSSTKT